MVGAEALIISLESDARSHIWHTGDVDAATEARLKTCHDVLVNGGQGTGIHWG